ncbi:hypothetical protein, partial [Acidithiobacillus thiooxidans]|uniref:hypothetical protein n=1 Tax=Acidithiobacillus thiooxidans TaxID=930 RepID=UPI001C06B0E4
MSIIRCNLHCLSRTAERSNKRRLSWAGFVAGLGWRAGMDRTSNRERLFQIKQGVDFLALAA